MIDWPDVPPVSWDVTDMVSPMAYPVSLTFKVIPVGIFELLFSVWMYSNVKGTESVASPYVADIV